MDEWQKKVAAMKSARLNRKATTPSSPKPSLSKAATSPSLKAIPNKPLPASPAAGASRSPIPVKASPKAERNTTVSAQGYKATSPAVGRPATSIAVSSSAADDDWQALFEKEMKKRLDAEQALTSKDNELGVLRKKLIEMSGSDLAKQVVAGGGSVTRELNLMKTELRVTKMKLDSEVRKREALERQMERKTKELDDLKTRPSAKQMVDKSKKQMEMTNAKRKMDLKANRMKMQATRLATERGLDRKSVMRPRQSVRQSKRMTRAPKTDIVSMVTRVLQEMEKLEGNIKKEEAGRMQAESELLEVAMYKQEADDALESLANDLRLQLVFFSQYIGSLKSAASEASGSTKTALESLVEKFNKMKDDIEKRLTEKNVKKDTNNAAEMNKRASVYATQLNLPPPPPAMQGFQVAGRGPARGSPAANAPAPSALLDQIRKGKNLNRINVAALKAERAQNYKSNRKSMALLSSLQDTLRNALNTRREDLDLEGGDDDDDDDWEEWDDA